MTERQRKIETDYRRKLIKKYGVKDAAVELIMPYGSLRYWMWVNGIKVQDLRAEKLPYEEREA